MSLRFSAVLVFVFLFCGPRAAADDRVMVKSKADSEYEAQKFGGKIPKRETYLVCKGRYYESDFIDRSIERTSFVQIVNTMAQGLVKQNYYPATDLKTADLLIFVHWGTTAAIKSTYEMLGETSFQSTGNYDQSGNTQAVANLLTAPGNSPSENVMLIAGMQSDMSARFDAQADFDSLLHETDRLSQNVSMAGNARLLGVEEDLWEDQKRIWSDSAGVTLRDCLAESRYFIVVRAFDFQKLLKEKVWKEVWTIHLSMRSPGTNFREDLPRMSFVGSNYFGKQMKSLSIEMPTVKEGHVEIGTPIVLGEAALPN